MVEAIRGTIKKIGKKVAAMMETDINAAIEPVFDFVAAEDVLPKVLTGYGLLPRVVRERYHPIMTTAEHKRDQFLEGLAHCLAPV